MKFNIIDLQSRETVATCRTEVQALALCSRLNRGFHGAAHFTIREVFPLSDVQVAAMDDMAGLRRAAA